MTIRYRLLNRPIHCSKIPAWMIGVILMIFGFTADAALSTSQPSIIVHGIPHISPVEHLDSAEEILPCLPDDPDDWALFSPLDKQSPACKLTRGPSSIRLRIADEPEADSTAAFIDLHFQEHVIRLMSPPGGFGRNMLLLYDLVPLASFFDSFSSDCWDSLTLVFNDDDSMTIGEFLVIHNGSLILDWSGSQTLSDNLMSRQGFAREILATKVDQCPGTANGIAWWALCESGKDDGEKYSPTFPGGWCSEFASWVMRHNGWSTPQGSIGTRHLREYFAQFGRLYTINDVYTGLHTPTMGDYLSMWNGGHSGIFLGFSDPDPEISPDTSIITIEGGGLVSIHTRTLSDIDHVGDAR